jgi:Plasmid pRiA4b ORF-3-like protein
MAARKRASVTLKLYELHVELEDIEPRIWRRILVPGSIKLPQLHDLLQLVMGWTDSHLHSFEFGKKVFSSRQAELEELNMLDEAKHTLESVLGDSLREFVYEYDFGDSWRHLIQVKLVAKPNTEWFYPLCVAGERATPPDDVGGAPGYMEFLDAIKNPKHPEHESMLIWIGGAFDPEGFDLNTINRTLRFGSP